VSDLLDRLRKALADRYTIERELGRGGMAVVYLAEDVKHGRHVAVKVLLPELAATLGGERFLQEIRVTAKLTHPHILTLIDSAEADSLLYYVMPFVEGESLRDRLKRERQLPVEDALQITKQVASALEFAHRHEVIHRDIKPENILLHEGEAMVADFGIALAVRAAGGERLTETGLSIGTPAYMSPEQVSGEQEIDGRSDIYALACVLYEMLAGDPPFVASNPRAVMAKHMTDTAPPITTVRSSVPSPVATALAKALGKAPVDRFESVKVFSEALVATEVAAEQTKTSIVVLPFENLSPDPDNEYFSDGLTDELIAELSRVQALRVISRTSAMQFKGTKKRIPAIAQELEVTYAVEGTVRRAGDAIRITAQLIDAGADAQLWSERYSGKLDDVFDLQEDLARRITEALNIVLSPAEEERLASRPIPDARAHDAFLLARHELYKFTKPGVDRAVELINGSLESFGDSALLHATLGYAYWAAYDFGIYHDDETLDRAEASVAKAMNLDAELPLAYLALGLVRYKRRDMQALIDNAKHAVALEPTSDALLMLGFCLAEVGFIDEAKRYSDEAVAMDPLSFLPACAPAVVDLFAGDFSAATEKMLAARERFAPGEAFSGWWAAQCLGYSGREEEAHELYRQVADMKVGFFSDHCALFQRALEQDRDGVLELLEKSDYREAAETDEQYPIHIANALTLVGEIDEALRWLRHAIEYGFLNYRFLSQHDRFLVPLRGDAHFEQLMEIARQRHDAFRV
jgi:serine/threonine-protein kinase